MFRRRPKSVVSSTNEAHRPSTATSASKSSVFTGPSKSSTCTAVTVATTPAPPPVNNELQSHIASTARKVSSSEVRDLNQLIRNRHVLDVEIWSLRGVRRVDRDFVQDLMQRADAALQQIMGIIRAWDDPDMWWNPEDWERLHGLRQRLELGGKRLWEGNPPWGEQD
jgi:hypothetical protein